MTPTPLNPESEQVQMHIDLSKRAILLSRQKEYQQAEALFQYVLTLCQESLGDENLNTMQCQFNLASCYADQGKFEQAERLLQQVFDKSKRVWGAAHAFTDKSMHKLASCYTRQGKYGQAIFLYEHALDLHRQDFVLSLSKSGKQEGPEIYFCSFTKAAQAQFRHAGEYHVLPRAESVA